MNVAFLGGPLYRFNVYIVLRECIDHWQEIIHTILKQTDDDMLLTRRQRFHNFSDLKHVVFRRFLQFELVGWISHTLTRFYERATFIQLSMLINLQWLSGSGAMTTNDVYHLMINDTMNIRFNIIDRLSLQCQP